jgi:hypothetical protein
MSSGIVYERIVQETEIARQWWQLPSGTLLPLADGQQCLLIYAGEPGGPAGPDVRDVVVHFFPPDSSSAETMFSTDERTSEISPHPSADPNAATIAFVSSENASKVNLYPSDPQNKATVALVGDVEFHIRASDWFTHSHHTDPRYNQVLLHVVLYLDSERPTQRQDGIQIPTCSLLDLPRTPLQTSPWPCQQTPLTPLATTTTLLYAGLLRFHEKSQALSQALAETHPPPDSAFNAYDTCLLTALAEALGYGRDRAFFRAIGLRLVGLPTHIPEPLGHKPYPAPLDARRLHILSALSARWRQTGIWHTLLPILQPEIPTKSALTALRTTLQPEQPTKSALTALRATFHPLSQARTDILICNIILPFAVVIANLENNTRLAVRAQQLYLAYPTLASNRITRMIVGGHIWGFKSSA